MEKIFKKSLALVLSAALCLTALVGCLTVSAEGASATVTVGSVEVNSDATKATVPVTITATGDGIAAAMFELKVDTTKINLSGLWEDIATNIKTESDSIGINVSVSNDGDNVTTVASEDVYRFIVEGVDPTSGENVSIKQFTNASFDLTFNIASGVTGENAIEFVNDTHAQACNAGTFDINTGKYTGDEVPFTLTGTNGAVTVKAASTEQVEITNNLLAHNLYLSASVGSEIAVNVSAKNGLTTLGYSDYYLTIEYNHYISGYKLEAAEPITLLPSQRYRQNTAGTVDYFTFTSLALYEMPLDYTVTLYLKNESGDTVAFKKDTTSVVTQALTYTKKYSTDAQLLCMMVDMVNYGAAVQEFFAKVNPSSDIATAVLPTVGFEEYQNYASSSDVLPEQFNNIKSLEKVVTESTLNATSTVIIGASNNIEYTFLANDYDQSKLVAEIEYIDSYNRTIKDTINFTDMERKVSPKGNVTYRCIFDKLAIYDAEKTVSVKLINDGIQEATYTYSLGNFVNSYIKTEGFTDMLTKMELFSRSARIKLVGE